MALNLSLINIVQSNDSTILKIQDNTGVYSANNIGGWGAPNAALSTINGITNSLTLTFTITTSDGTETSYDPIDVYTYLGATPLTYDAILLYLTPADIKINGMAIGTDEDELPDGWYSLEYKLTSISGGTLLDVYTVQFVVDGVVRNKIYTQLMSIPTTVYTSTPFRVNVHNWDELTKPIYLLSLFEGMIAYVTPSKKNNILDTLNLLERLTS